jgi:hypothetical protein
MLMAAGRSRRPAALTEALKVPPGPKAAQSLGVMA